MHYLTIFLLLFPFFKFGADLGAAVTPWPIIALTPLFLFGVLKTDMVQFKKLYILAFLYFFARLIIDWVFVGLPMLPGLINVFLFISGPAVAVYISQYAGRNSRGFYIFLMIVTLLVAVLQTFMPDNIVVDVIKASVSSQYHFSGAGPRGVPSIAPEPSYFAFSFFALVALYLEKNESESRIKYQRLVLLIIAVTVLLNKSSTILVLALFFVGYIYKNSSMFDKYIILSGGLVACVTFALMENQENYRMLDLFNSIKRAVDEQGVTINQIADLGGKRFITVFSSYSLLLDNLLGYGFGNYREGLSIGYNRLGIDWSQIEQSFQESEFASIDDFKPDSFLALLALEGGILGFLLFIALIKSAWHKSYTKLGYMCFGLAVLLLLFDSTTSMPAPWIFLGIALRHAMAKSPVLGQKTLL